MAGAQGINIYLFIHLFESKPHKDRFSMQMKKFAVGQCRYQAPLGTQHAYAVAQCKKKITETVFCYDID